MNLKKMVEERVSKPTVTQAKDRGKYIYISWAAHLMAWSIYAELFGKQQTAERLAQRGGFGESELDAFYPEWRNHIVSPPH